MERTAIVANENLEGKGQRKNTYRNKDVFGHFEVPGKNNM